MLDQPTLVRGRLSLRGLEALRKIFVALFALVAPVEARGLENLPSSGGFIITPNHLSYLDPPLLFTAVHGRRLAVFAADTYRRNPLFRWIIECVDAIWVHRGAISPSTIRLGVQALHEGRVLGIAPEGTRSRTHALQPGKTGAAFLAMTAGVPIVPAAITNTDKVIPALKRLRRIRLTITFGQPFTLPEPERAQRAGKLEAYTTEIMCRIAALLPPEYRGVYTDHPRLKELLAQG